MPESQDSIDALLAEVSNLADDAVAQIEQDQAEGGKTEKPNASAETSDTSDQSAPDAQPTSPETEPASPDDPDSAQPTPFKLPKSGVMATSQPHSPPDPTRILTLQVPVIVRLAERQMKLSEILNLTTGAIIEFEKSADSELELMINDQCIGQGQAVKVGENFGLRVTYIGTVHERIRAMGPEGGR